MALSELTVLDVIGVDNESDGRSCTSHAICGHFVTINSILVCKWAVQEFGEGPEECVQVWRVSPQDGLANCHVGYIPRRYFKRNTPKEFENLVLEVSEDLRISDNSHERQRSHRNYGLVVCNIIRGNPHFEGKRVFEGEPFVFPPTEDTNESLSTSSEDVDMEE